MIAHKRESDGKEQSLREHSRNVSKLCRLAAEDIRLEKLAELTGLLHDLGKGIKDFQNYLRGSDNKHPFHAGIGALFAWKKWGCDNQNVRERRNAQLISLCIYGHHAGLPDCLNDSGHSPYLDGLQDQRNDYFEEAIENFYKEVASEEELDALFADANRELEEWKADRSSFDFGMIVRLVLSVLVDADRWDSACFEYETDPFATQQKRYPDWEKLIIALEGCLQQFPQEGRLDEIRRGISESCRVAGESGTGIYTLSVPTGGGKTYSSLRFALYQAKRNGQGRIFYFIPMNTILDQNSEDIRKALKNYPSILEHHSDIVLEKEQEEENYRRLSERWESDIILTSLVQFLEVLFQNGNGKVRRMYRLANSVLIFDEIQALPKKCRGLFRLAIQFLVQYCKCTVLLCTATQPALGVKAKEVMPDVEALYRELKRVEYIPQLEGRTYQNAAEDIICFFQRKKSVLMIVNTKEAAWTIFRGVSDRLQASGFYSAEMKSGLSDNELEELAEKSTEKEILCVHLSTNMCPAHRKEILRWMKAWLRQKKQVCCVSTALIEAGINVSFPIVIRSLAGIPSVIQAAGRCNRNCEADQGEVYLWNLMEEKLSRLPDIQKGKEISLNLLSEPGKAAKIGTPNMIEDYFDREKTYAQKVERYPYPQWNSDLVTMLSANNECRMAAGGMQNTPLSHLSKRLHQSFRTAGAYFQVIDEKTKSVLVPYRRGKELIEKLSSRHTLGEENRYLKEAQQYSVKLYEHVYTRLAKEGALHAIREPGILALKEEYYDAGSGVLLTPQEMQDLIY